LNVMFLPMKKTGVGLYYTTVKRSAARASLQVCRMWRLADEMVFAGNTSSGKKMVVTAQDELTLICGGGYIKIKGGNVEIGGPGKLLIKNAGIKKAGSGSMQGVMKSFEPSTFDEKFVITHPVTGKPLANQNYDIHMPDGKVLSGITDSSGNSSLIMSKAVDGLKIVLKK
ncbi:DUF2345 domain-containing protein, partial [Lonsdalea quercina]|uniref:DUF2345 domain-containing protein n=1 Tax=Lonsdalea quercina TaxID=71657 RepID=UPI003975ADEE